MNRRVLLRSGLPRRYARFRGQITSADGTPIPGGAIARSRYLKDTVRADDQGYYEGISSKAKCLYYRKGNLLLLW